MLSPQVFRGTFQACAERLGQLLDIDICRNSPDLDTPIGRMFVHIWILHQKGRTRERDFELYRIGHLEKNLREVREADPEQFDTLSTQIVDLPRHRYYGVRFEVYVTASLIRKGVDYEAPDPPDFRLLRSDGAPLVIEATSAHLRRPREEAIRHKLWDAVKGKSGKDYCGPGSALFIEGTNLYHHAWKRGEGLGKEKIREWLSDPLTGENFGAAAVFVTLLTGDDDIPLRTNYIRAVHDDADPRLIDFIDRWFEMGEEREERPIIPDIP